MARSNESVKFIGMGGGTRTSGGNRSGRCSAALGLQPLTRDRGWTLCPSSDSPLCGFVVDWRRPKAVANVSLGSERFVSYLRVPLNFYMKMYNSGLYLPQRQGWGANRCLRQLQKDRLGANITHPCVCCCGKGELFFVCECVQNTKTAVCVWVCVCMCVLLVNSQFKENLIPSFVPQQRAQFGGKEWSLLNWTQPRWPLERFTHRNGREGKTAPC